MKLRYFSAQSLAFRDKNGKITSCPFETAPNDGDHLV